MTNQFLDVEDFETFCNEFYRKMIEVEGEEGGVMAEILDPYQVEETLMEWEVRDYDVFLILYSVARFESFLKVKEYLEFVYRVKERGDVPIVVVGHKIGLEREREVSKEEGEEYIGLHEGVLFMEASAKTGENVVEVFEMAAKRHRELELLQRERNEEENGGKEWWSRREDVPPPIVHEISRGRTVKPAKR